MSPRKMDSSPNGASEKGAFEILSSLGGAKRGGKTREDGPL